MDNRKDAMHYLLQEKKQYKQKFGRQGTLEIVNNRIVKDSIHQNERFV